MPLAEKIKLLRKEKGWSQYQLGEKVGVHGKHVSKWENDKFVPNLEAVRKLARLFEVSTDYLLFDDVPRGNQVSLHDPEMLEQFEKVEKLNSEDKEAVKRIIQAMISNQEVKIAMGG
jgi:transcriptional regulator with XRE-family HTH domain